MITIFSSAFLGIFSASAYSSTYSLTMLERGLIMSPYPLPIDPLGSCRHSKELIFRGFCCFGGMLPLGLRYSPKSSAARGRILAIFNLNSLFILKRAN